MHRAMLARTAAITAIAASMVLAAGAVPALAKEGLLAQLDAPIALGTPAGTELIVGVTVTAVDTDGVHPVEGSPIQLVLTGRDGSTTRAAGAFDGTPGHYVMRITVPSGGARKAEVVMHGTSDLPLTLVDDPFAFGPVTARTAQVAPPPAAALTPLPRASSALTAPVAIPPVAPVAIPPTAEPAAAAGTTGLEPVLVALVVVLALGLLVVAASRRSRAAAPRTEAPPTEAPPAATDRAPGA